MKKIMNKIKNVLKLILISHINIDIISNTKDYNNIDINKK